MAQNRANTFPATGNVGIGTSTPTKTLHVNGEIKLDNLPISNRIENANDFYLKIDENGNIYKSGSTYNTIDPDEPSDDCLLESIDRQHPVWKNGVDKLYPYCSQVKVGIGTRTPRVLLDVNGSGYMGHLSIGTATPNTFTANHDHLLWIKSSVSDGNTYNTKPIVVVENATRKLFQIQNDGLVRAREIKVDLATSWPDYVFKPTYELMPLTEVKQYISQNGHLPNIPAAESLETDGLPLGEMNRLLMEKVEELTLYMIQMQEEQERFKTEMEELKTKNLGR